MAPRTNQYGWLRLRSPGGRRTSCVCRVLAGGIDPSVRRKLSRRTGASATETSIEEAAVVLLWVLVALLLLFAIVGGVAISKFLFLLLIVVAVLALIGFFTRTA
jgi:hypothetical protein